jgi:uncharacterized protein YjdB
MSVARWARPLLAALLVLLTARCDNPTDPVDGVAEVVVTPAAVTLTFSGETVALTATALDDEGDPLEEAGFAWSSSDTDVATVAGSDRNAMVTATGPGSAVITAALPEASGDAAVTVALAVNAIEVIPDLLELVVGASGDLTAVATDAGGGGIAGVAFEWTSSDDAVATVDGQGSVMGVTPGTVTVTASAGDREGEATVIVEKAAVDSVEVQPDSAEVVVGGMVAYTVRAFDEGGNELFGRPVMWTTGDDGVATVDESGTVTGVAEGVTTVTATVEAVSDDAKVVVSVPVAGGLTCGDLVSGSIEAAGEVDEYTFEGTSGAVISLVLVETTDWGGFQGGNDARGTLLSPTDAQVAMFDSNAQRILAAAETGTHTVRVTANNGTATGTYNLGFECILPTSPVDGTLQPGDLLAGSLTERGEVDQYTFEGTAGDLISLMLVETTDWGGFQGGNDARGILYAPSGAEVGGVFDSNIMPEYTLPETGTYVLRVYANNLVSTGDYNLGLESILPTPVSQGALTCDGSTISESITQAGEVDLFTFSGTSGQDVTLTLTETSNWGGFQGGNDARGLLYAPSGAAVGNAFDSDAQVQLTLPANGTYVLRVTANNLVSTGTYDVACQ